MQILITHSSLKASRVLYFTRMQLLVALVGMLLAAILVAVAAYHVLFLTAAREGWPIVSEVVRMVQDDQGAQRDRYLRENLDVMARKVGEMQARLVQLEAMSERVSGLAGFKPQELKTLQRPTDAPAAGGGRGGPFVPAYGPGSALTLQQLDDMVGALEARADRNSDVFALIESRLFEKRLTALMVPNSRPVEVSVGSGFGFRADPFSGRAALHTGLDFPADTGTPIHAAAGGVVLSVGMHPQYGQMVELDHGRGLVTRYAHTSRVLVRLGDLVRRGQPIAQVGSTGRSTGPHLHFEVLVDGVQQDPAKFLAVPETPALASAAMGSSRH